MITIDSIQRLPLGIVRMFWNVTFDIFCPKIFFFAFAYILVQ